MDIDREINFGSVGGLKLIWGLLDTFMAITVAINLIVLVIMKDDVVKLTKEFFSSDKYIKINSEANKTS
jgi:AGCS family alanine or glycine:cation symporter